MRLATWIGALLVISFLTLSTGPTQATQVDPYAPLKRFSQVLDLIENNYVREVTREDLHRRRHQGHAHSNSTRIPRSWTKTSSRTCRSSTSGEFGGVGIEISTLKNNRLTVIAPIEDTPGFQGRTSKPETSSWKSTTRVHPGHHPDRGREKNPRPQGLHRGAYHPAQG